MAEPVYRRVVVKLSGEYLAGSHGYGIDQPTVDRIASDLIAAQKQGTEIAVVIGGGNIIRGVEVSARGVSRPTGDTMGMLATVMNALALADTMRQEGITARVMSAIAIEQVVEPYVRPKALQYLEEGKVVVFAAGTGNPFFTTDTAASLRAMEMHAEVILKATKVDGIYSADPMKDPTATRYKNLTYLDVLKKNLKVMDSTAISLCMDNELPIIVFDLGAAGNIMRVVKGEDVGTLVGTLKPQAEQEA